MTLPLTPPNINQILAEKQLSQEKLLSIFTTFEPIDHKERYLHWDELRHREPPAGFTVEEVWIGTKLARMKLRKELPFVDGDKRPFIFTIPAPVLEMLYQIDQSLEPVANADRHNVLIEEAISSSQLEGAATTRKIAKEMIRQQRPPKDHSEQMIMNNYHAMLFVQAHKNEKLTPSIILELHRIVTDKTLGDSDTAGQCRTSDDVQVIDREGNILHTPPPADTLPQRLQTLCDFANEHDSSPFIHPIIRAILLHFVLAYDHPFVDGNGRTARALFYWMMAQKKYELMGLLSISGAIKTAPAQYARAFLYTETDENDTTYFIIHQLHVIQAAMEQWHTALARKREELGSAVGLLAGTRLDGKLNGRQLQLLQHALNNPGAIYRIKAHQSVHGVTYQTARTDLLAMSDEWGLLHRVKEGKMFIFLSPPDLRQRLDGV